MRVVPVGRLLFLGVLLQVCGPAALAAQQIDAAAFSRYVEAARAEWDVPGVAIAVVHGDEVVFAGGRGLLDADRSDRVDEHTVFAIGSSTKAMTATALGILVEEGRIGWDDPVVDHLPAFRLPDPWLTARITVRDLVTHRTGVRPAGLLWTGSGFDRAEIVERLRHHDGTVPFRARFLYNNEMFVVAGELILEVTGKTWDELLHDRIFEPLGMSRTNTTIDSLAEMGNVASPHVADSGRNVPVDYRWIDNVGPAGSVNSSVLDLAQWLRLNLSEGTHRGRRILAEETVRELHSAQFLWSGPGPDLETRFAAYGLGWFLYDFRGLKVVEHGGAIDGMHALVGMIPEKGIGVAVLTNRLGHRLPYALMYRAFDELLEGPVADWSGDMKRRADEAASRAEARRRAQASSDSAQAPPPTLPLGAYAGTYRSPLYGTLRITVEDDSLHLHRGDSDARLEHAEHDVFRARWSSPGLASVLGATEARFHLDPRGTVARFELVGLAAEWVRARDRP